MTLDPLDSNFFVYNSRQITWAILCYSVRSTKFENKVIFILRDEKSSIYLVGIIKSWTPLNMKEANHIQIHPADCEIVYGWSIYTF